LAAAEVKRSDDDFRSLTPDADAAIETGEKLELASGVVVGAIVDDQKLEVVKFLAQHALDRSRQPTRAVAHRHDY
jgi:hypothetical protein